MVRERLEKPKREKLQKKTGKLFKSDEDNPRGRPKGYRELRALCREHTEEAVKTLVWVMRHHKKKMPHSCVTAIATILDRGWGKAEQAHRFNAGENAQIGGVLVVPGMASPEEWLKAHGRMKPANDDPNSGKPPPQQTQRKSI